MVRAYSKLLFCETSVVRSELATVDHGVDMWASFDNLSEGPQDAK